MTEVNAKRVERFDGATLYLGDCLEVLPGLGAVDAIITDPPYGESATHAAHLSTFTLRSGEPAGRALDFDGISAAALISMAGEWVNLSSGWVVFSTEWKYAHHLDNAGYLIRLGVWRKPDAAPQFSGDRPGMGWEAVAICHRPGKKKWNGGGRHAFWAVPKAGETSHPTEKPIKLIRCWVSDFSNRQDVVLDPFMGSGTTGVAALQLGRKFIGIENNETYYDMACRRVDQAARQKDLFYTAPVAPRAEQLAIGI